MVTLQQFLSKLFKHTSNHNVGLLFAVQQKSGGGYLADYQQTSSKKYFSFFTSFLIICALRFCSVLSQLLSFSLRDISQYYLEMCYNPKLRIAFLTLLSVLCCSAITAQSPEHEMRATWVATVAPTWSSFSIDWHQSAIASSQQRKMIQILDFAQNLGINAVFFQVRSQVEAEKVNVADISVFPNPFVSELIIGGNGIQLESYTIYYLKDAMINFCNINTMQIRIDASRLNSGVYIL